MVQSDSDGLESFERWARGHQRCPEYVGLSRLDAIEEAERKGKAETMRILDLDAEDERQLWHMDLRPDRLNVVVRRGTVIAAALF